MCTIPVAKTKALRLFFFTYAKIRFSQDAAHISPSSVKIV